MTAAQYKPNEEIDKAIQALLKRIDKEMAPDTVCKIIATAMTWEKIKLGATRPHSFDPDELDT